MGSCSGRACAATMVMMRESKEERRGESARDWTRIWVEKLCGSKGCGTRSCVDVPAPSVPVPPLLFLPSPSPLLNASTPPPRHPSASSAQRPFSDFSGVTPSFNDFAHAPWAKRAARRAVSVVSRRLRFAGGFSPGETRRHFSLRDSCNDAARPLGPRPRGVGGARHDPQLRSGVPALAERARQDLRDGGGGCVPCCGRGRGWSRAGGESGVSAAVRSVSPRPPRPPARTARPPRPSARAAECAR